MFNIFKRKKSSVILNIDNLAELNLLTKEEILLIKKDRAIKEWESATKPEKKKTRA